MLFKLITALFSFLLVISVNASEMRRDTLLVEDLSDEFLIYDKNFGTYVPIDKSNGDILNLYNDYSRYKDYSLAFKASPGLSLLVDYKLIYQNLTGEEQSAIIPISKIQYKPGKRLISFFNEKGYLPSKVTITHVGNPYERVGDIYYSVRIKKGGELEFYLFLLILTLFTVIKSRYPKRLYDALSFFKNSNLDDTGALSDLFSSSSLSIILLNSLGFTYLYSLIDFPGKGKEVTLISLSVVGALIFLGFFFKYVLLQMVGKIFNIRSLANLHYVELVKFTLMLNVILLPLFTLASFSEMINFNLPYSFFLVILIGGLVLVLFKLLVLTFRVPDFKYIYLFSYLCIGELIPLGFILKITLL